MKVFFLAISTFLFQELKSSPVEEAGQGFFLEDIKPSFFLCLGWRRLNTTANHYHDKDLNLMLASFTLSKCPGLIFINTGKSQV